MKKQEHIFQPPGVAFIKLPRIPLLSSPASPLARAPLVRVIAEELHRRLLDDLATTGTLAKALKESGAIAAEKILNTSSR